MPTARTRLTITQAAEAAQVSRVTIRRYLEGGRFPGAEQARRGKVTEWRIPIEDLLAAGLRLNAPTKPDQASGPAAAPALVDGELAAEVERLRRELADERARRQVAEAVADERARALDDFRMVFRALPPAPDPEPAAPTADRRRRRLFGQAQQRP